MAKQKFLKLDELEESLLLAVESIEAILRANIPQKGDIAEDCQLITCLNALKGFEYTINGIEARDLVYDKNSDYPDTRLNQR